MSAQPETIRCALCERTLKRPKTYDSAPPHKCPHGKRCNRWRQECSICVAIAEARADALAPPCIFCNPHAGLRKPGLRGVVLDVTRADPGGCAACGFGVRRGGGHGDPELLEEIRATTGDVFAPLR